MWHHPKYYEEMKRKRKELERQASSNKQKGKSKDEHQASSDKRQASEQDRQLRSMKPGPFKMGIGLKLQATSSRDPDTRVLIIQSVRQIVAVMI
jgi:hypothetical protein